MTHRNHQRVVSLWLIVTLALLEGPLGVYGTKGDGTRATVLQDPVLQPSTLHHEYFPVILRGSDLPQLEGLWDNNLRIAFYQEGWHLEQFQIDERDPQQSDVMTHGGYVATEPGHPHQAADTSDPTHQLGKDDELVFYARRGAQVSEATWWDLNYPDRIEIRIQEPPHAGNGTAWMYLHYTTQDLGRWRDDPAYYDYITWTGKTGDWYTVETDWYRSSRHDQNPGIQDLLQITEFGGANGKDLLEEGVKLYTAASAELPWPAGTVQAAVREGHWNGTYYDEVVDNVGYGGSRRDQNSADGVACIDGPVRMIYFMTHFYSYTLLGLPAVQLEVETWVAAYVVGSMNGPIPVTNQITPVTYLEQLLTTSCAPIDGMRFVDETGKRGLIDANPENDDFVSSLNAPSHWGFYYGAAGSLWLAIPYDSLLSHGCEVHLYWADTTPGHRGEAGPYTKFLPGDATWWTAPIWTFVGAALNSDSPAYAQAVTYQVLYENWLQIGNFFHLPRESIPLPSPLSPYTRPIFTWAPFLLVLIVIGIGVLWKRRKPS